MSRSGRKAAESDNMEEKGMSDTEKNAAEASAEEKGAVSRNFIEQLIDKDLEEGVYDTVHTRFPP